MKQFVRKQLTRLRLRPLACVCLAMIAVSLLHGQEFPVQKFTTSDGLSQDNVNKIVRDSRGFLWFCTGDGLSRFDGNRFKNYTQEQGLPHRNVNDLLETRTGEYLVATSGGLSVFDPYGTAVRWNVIDGRLEDLAGRSPMFKTFTPPENSRSRLWSSVLELAEHSDGHIYAATNHGLFRVTGSGSERRFEAVDFEDWRSRDGAFNSIREDSRGGLWIAAAFGIYRMDQAGTITKIHELGGNSIFEDREGRIWLDCGGHDIGIRRYRLEGDQVAGEPDIFDTRNGLKTNGFTNAIAHDRDGRIYAHSIGSLYEFVEKDSRFVLIDDGPVSGAVVEPDGDVWFASSGNGVLKLAASDFKTVKGHNGSGPTQGIASIYIDRSGSVCLIADYGKIFVVKDGYIRNLPVRGLERRAWSEKFLDVQTAGGDWWIPTEQGLYRYPRASNVFDLEYIEPKVYKAPGKDNGAFTVFADSTGGLWFSLDGLTSLYRMDIATEQIVQQDMPGITEKNGGVVSYAEDRAGNIWVGFFYGGLGRFRDGVFQKFAAADGIPESYVSDFLVDAEGRLWLTTRSRGVFRIDDPDAEKPGFTSISSRDGLISNETNCITQDRFGAIYVGTGRGLHRLDTKTGSVKVYTDRDGLPGNFVTLCRQAPDGDIWLIASGELTKFKPEENVRSSAATAYIDGFVVNGERQRISELGERSLSEIELGAGQNRIEISYFALGLSSGETPRYQYRLGDGEWSTLMPASSVAFDLAPGSYDFSVRAVASDNSIGDTPATLSFSIAAPVWQRWWFVLLSFLIVGGAIFALDRYRVSKTHQVEQALALTRESEMRFRTLADTASDAIITIDDESTIVFANEAVERVFGYKGEEMIGKKLTSLMPDRMRNGHDSGLARYISSHTKKIPWSGVSLPGLHKDGHEVPLELSFGEFEREGRKFFTGIARDVTERIRAEEEIRKAREERMLELQKVRSRIATDLHDDIGSSLTQIAVLTEVARGQASQLSSDGVATPLERIKNVSKELVAVMSDIVWAINPQKDYLSDLVQRMRRFGSDVLSGRGIAFEFNAPEVIDSMELGANIRREVFAIFKESINNAAKYAECSRLVTDFEISDDELRLEVRDNGQGFDAGVVLSDDFRPEMGGNGLASIRRRAAELGGFCEITSAPGKGTEIRLVVPLHPHLPK